MASAGKRWPIRSRPSASCACSGTWGGCPIRTWLSLEKWSACTWVFEGLPTCREGRPIGSRAISVAVCRIETEDRAPGTRDRGVPAGRLLARPAGPEGGSMIGPYNAVGLIPSFWGIRRREDMEKNLEHLESLTKAAFWLSNLDIPVRLI